VSRPVAGSSCALGAQSRLYRPNRDQTSGTSCETYPHRQVDPKARLPDGPLAHPPHLRQTLKALEYNALIWNLVQVLDKLERGVP